MYTFEPLTTLNTQQWNAFVHAHPQATPYHLSYWQSAIEEAYGHKVASVLVKKDDQIIGVLPLIKFKTILKQASLISLPFCDVGSWLSTESSATEALKENLKDEIVELRERGKPVAMDELELYAQQHNKVSMVLSLSDNSDALLASYKPKLRSQIKKATKNGLTVKFAEGSQLIDDFYQVISANMRDLGSPVHSKAFFKAIMNEYSTFALTCIVYSEDTPCAAGLILKTETKACIPWASSLREFNRLAPNMLLYWSFLAHCADSGITEFDFGRSTVNEGTYRFKKQWGAEPVALNWYQLSAALTPDNAPQTTSALRSFVEKTWQKLPLAITIAIGPKVRKYISL